MKRILLIIASCALCSSATAGTFSGQVNVSGGFDANPTGYSGGEAQSIGSTTLELGWTSPVGGPAGSFSLNYSGAGSAFAPASDWTTHNHTLSAGYERGVTDILLVGLQGGVGGTWNRPAYDAYSCRQASGEFWAQAFLGPVPLFASVGGLVCKYPSSEEFNFRELTVSGFTSFQFPTRTTARLAVLRTGRTYTTQTLEDILAGIDKATSSQLQASVQLSQGLTDESGLMLSAWVLSGSGESRWRDDYAQAMDDPLSAGGMGGRLQFSTLAPAMMTFRTYAGFARTTTSYVDALSQYAERTDNVSELGAILEGPVPGLSQVSKLTWSAELNGRRQTSGDPLYTFNTASIVAGLRYAW